MPKAQWIFDTETHYVIRQRNLTYRPIGTPRSRRYHHTDAVRSRIASIDIDDRQIAAFTSRYVVYTDGTSDLTDEYVYECMSCRKNMVFIAESGSYMAHYVSRVPTITKLPVDLADFISFDSTKGVVGALADGSLVSIKWRSDCTLKCVPYVWPIPTSEFTHGCLSVCISGRVEEVDMKYINICNKYLFIGPDCKPIIARTTKRNRQALEELPNSYDFDVIDIAHGFVLTEMRGEYSVYDFHPDGKLVLVAGDVYYDAPPKKGRKSPYSAVLFWSK